MVVVWCLRRKEQRRTCPIFGVCDFRSPCLPRDGGTNQIQEGGLFFPTAPALRHSAASVLASGFLHYVVLCLRHQKYENTKISYRDPESPNVQIMITWMGSA